MELEQGVTAAGQAYGGPAWNVVGHVYTPTLVSENVFLWHAAIPAGTFVPPHVHPTQDEWIVMQEGVLEVEFGTETMTARPGDTIRMPMGKPHGIFNRSDAPAVALFGVAPARRLFELFGRLDGVTDPAELVRISAEHEVDFLPPPAG
ncbi:MAG: cupin domain-containing protein [Pseudomonadota bacterium]